MKTKECLNVSFCEATLYYIKCSCYYLSLACLSLTCSCLSRFGFRTEEPNRGSRSAPRRNFSRWVWCRATGRCWEACTSSRPAWLDSTTPSPWLTSPACPPCCPPGRTPATRARSASAPAPASHLRRPPSGSMKTGTALWGATSPHPCSLWPPCSLWSRPLTGAKK